MAGAFKVKVVVSGFGPVLGEQRKTDERWDESTKGWVYWAVRISSAFRTVSISPDIWRSIEVAEGCTVATTSLRSVTTGIVT
jgi:hypothetical protein